MRKTPVEAIQWTGDNQREVYDFMNKTARTCCNAADSSGNLIMFWKDFARRKFKAVVPMLGWVVRDDKAFKFYKDSSFRKTFEEVLEDDNKGVDWDTMSKTIHKAFNGFDEVFKGFKDVFGAEPSKEILDAIKIGARTESDGRLFRIADDVYRNDDKMREEVKKHLSEGLNGMAGSDTNKATFESVLDEMKELHAKKNSDYGDAAHVNFLKYGPVASLSRLSEKVQRAEHILLSGKCEVKDEPLTQTLIDMAITSAMLYMELKNKDNG